MAIRMPTGKFVSGLEAALNRKDGYIMGATGQNPKKWSTGSWWFTQYSGSQRTKALYWREHAQRVWDCNGLAEGLYKDYTGTDINTKARYNYSGWCGVKGTGTIPAKYRVPGAAVFWGNTASSIHHVAYLYKPVSDGNPSGDWYLIEARGVMYGVVKTKLNSRKPDFWGLMDKYFDYSDTIQEAVTLHMGDRLLKKGMEGSDVKELQEALVRLGYSLPKYGADGEYGSETVSAVKAFQKDHGLDVDGEYGEKSHAAMEKALVELDDDEPDSDPEDAPETPAVPSTEGDVLISGGDAWLRTGPGTQYDKAGVAKKGERFTHANPDNWVPVVKDGKILWVSGKYAKVVEA